MSTSVVRDWVNGQPDLPQAFLTEQRSPASGTYSVLTRVQSSLPASLVAEPGSGLTWVRVQFRVYAGTPEASELAAKTLRAAIETLAGNPVLVGGAQILVHDNLSGPSAVPMPPDSGEQFCYEVQADFLIAE